MDKWATKEDLNTVVSESVGGLDSESESDQEFVGELNVLKTRSGLIYPTPATSGTMTAANPPPPAGTIKVLPTEASVRVFTGVDDGYNGRAFLDICESVMRSSGVTQDEDKIAFVRSRIAPDSRAMRLMGSTAFSDTKLQGDYSKFHGNFIRVFCGSVETSVLSQLVYANDESLKHLEEKDLWEGTVPANELTKGCLRVLKDNNWFDADGNLPLSKVTKLLELQYYLLHVPRRVRQAAQTLSFKDTDELTDLVAKLELKLHEIEGNRKFIAPITNDKIPSSSSSSSPSSSSFTHPFSCTFCGKQGHTESRCFKKKRQSTSPQYTSQRSSTQTMQTQRKPFSRQHQQGMQGQTAHFNKQHTQQTYASSLKSQPNRVTQYTTQYCAYHGVCKHPTEACHDLHKMREQYASRSPVHANNSQTNQQNYAQNNISPTQTVPHTTNQNFYMDHASGPGQ